MGGSRGVVAELPPALALARSEQLRGRRIAGLAGDTGGAPDRVQEAQGL